MKQYMPTGNQAQRYQETEIRTASPIELVVLLYDAAISSLQKAQEHIAARNIEARTRCLNKAAAVITELQANLNFQAGGTIAPSLDRLYQYMKNSIVHANLRQETGPLVESVRLLTNLRSAWIEIARTEACTKKENTLEARFEREAPAPPMASGGPSHMALASLNIRG